MKKKIVNAVLMAALVVPSVGTLTSCKDYNEDLSVELRGETENLRKTLQDQIDLLKNLVAGIKQCECDLSVYLKKTEAEATYLKKEDLPDYTKEFAALTAADESLQRLIDEINGKLGNYATTEAVAQQISDLNTFILQVKATADEALELAKAGKCDCDFTEINNRLGQIDEKILGWNQQLKDVNTTASTALAKAESNYLWVIANKKTIDSLITVWNDAEVTKRLLEIETNYMKKDEINRLIGEAKQAAQDANDLASQAMSKAADALTAAGNAQQAADNAQQAADNAQQAANNAQQKADQNEIAIGELKKSLENYVTKDEFKTKMTEVEANIKKISDKVDELDAEIVKMKKNWANLITEIVPQAFENPVLGYFKTPFGIEQNMLAAYYGSADKGIEFPARDGKYYLEASDVDTWTERNLKVMGISSLKNVEGYFTKGDETFVTEVNGQELGNAGTVYVTVNPSNVNFNGQTIFLESSASNASPVSLEPLRYSNKELVMGVWRNGTRGYENGFYSAKATLRAEDVAKAKYVVDFKTIGQAIKDVVKNGPQDSRTRISVAEAAAKVFSALNYEVPAYALKASWTDADEKVHNIFSNYNIATVAVKPLSFAFLNDSKWKKVDGFDRMRSVVSRVIKEVEVARPDFAKYEIQFKSIELGDGVSVDGKKHILAQVYYVKDDGTTSGIELIPMEDVYGDIAPTITELVNDIKAYYGAESEVAQKVAEFFNEVKATNNYQDYIDATKTSIYEAIDKYLTRIENHILRVMNNAHRTLFITMFGEQNGKFALLSNSVETPTKATGEYTLIPTTYTLQYFAPVYKKFVAVTNVYDAATKQELALGEAQSLAKAANGGVNMFKVVDGLDNCTIQGEAGKIYELTYTAVDYHGVVMIKKFYVEF